jgi:RNA-directed DNA polymerase
VAGFLDEIEASLRAKSYKTVPVRPIYNTKHSGKLRPLGIPCVWDRVVQAAVLFILESQLLK